MRRPAMSSARSRPVAASCRRVSQPGRTPSRSPCSSTRSTGRRVRRAAGRLQRRPRAATTAAASPVAGVGRRVGRAEEPAPQGPVADHVLVEHTGFLETALAAEQRLQRALPLRAPVQHRAGEPIRDLDGNGEASNPGDGVGLAGPNGGYVTEAGRLFTTIGADAGVSRLDRGARRARLGVGGVHDRPDGHDRGGQADARRRSRPRRMRATRSAASAPPSTTSPSRTRASAAASPTTTSSSAAAATATTRACRRPRPRRSTSPSRSRACPGTTSRSGAPCPWSSGSPATCVASSRSPARCSAKRRP